MVSVWPFSPSCSPQPNSLAFSGLYDLRRLGRRIYAARKDRGLSIEELARLLSEFTGERVSPQMVKNMEVGRKRIDAALLPVLS